MDRRSMFRSAIVAAAGAVVSRGQAEAQATAGRNSRMRRSLYLEVKDGTPLYYEDWGNGQPVLFLHGAGSNWEQWNYNMLPLSEQLRCVAYDRRGHARSSDFGHNYSYDVLADDLAEVIQQLDLTQVTVVAHSMAGGEVVRYLTRHGADRIARIVLVGPTLPGNPEAVNRAAVAAMRAQWSRDYPGWILANARPFFTPETSEAMIQWGWTLVMRTPIRTAIECNKLVTESDFRGELRAVTVPTLILQGDKDVSAPIDSTGRPTARLIPGCTLKVYEGAAHGLFITHAERFNRDVLEFMTA